MADLDFVVFGKPVTQGSKTRTRWGLRDDNADTLKPWRANVTATAVEARQHAGWARAEGPVAVHARFYFDPPKSAPKRRRTWPTTRSSGDLDKLLRALFDGITDAGVWRDDAQVVQVIAAKLHTPGPLVMDMDCVTPRAVVTVSEVW